MPQTVDRSTLLGYFERRKKPTQAQYADLINTAVMFEADANSAQDSILLNYINEKTPGSGVTIESVVLNDGSVTAANGFVGNLVGTVTGNVIGDVTATTITSTSLSSTTIASNSIETSESGIPDVLKLDRHGLLHSSSALASANKAIKPLTSEVDSSLFNFDVGSSMWFKTVTLNVDMLNSSVAVLGGLSLTKSGVKYSGLTAAGLTLEVKLTSTGYILGVSEDPSSNGHSYELVFWYA